jgi:exodeoxyribonuclease VII small subunit
VANKSNSQPDIDKLDFETALARIEEIVAQLEQGQIGLTGSLEQYEAGVKHLKRCYELLERAEKKIEVLSGRDAEGNPQTTSFSDTDADSLAEKADSRSKRRSARRQKSAPPPKPAGEDNVDVPGGLF